MVPTMQPAFLVLSSFGFVILDFAQNHGGWTRSGFVLFAHGMSLLGLS